ncbi:PH domain-containing protein [Mammaliicoccus sp. Dog046]|uniref:PH domain-containing protein n=1 Tax=Mammaliicoccus sp. Dog046 TaxID=3034233 RepID=UPI002B26266F|nr:PH domain-containing protein [Mammaliicoccus sp. Dog046]WQK86130.1 PH domain-containing protein [Mammaliicoccus sp. Dog046]
MYKPILDNKMPRQSIKYEYLLHFFNVIFIILFFSVFVFLWRHFDWWSFLIYPVLILVLAIIIFGFIKPVIILRQTSFEVGDKFLEIQRGLYFQERHLQPYDRIQFVKVKHGPLSRMFDLYFIVIMTAGSMKILPMVNREIADQTRMKIMAKVKEVTDDV